MATSLCHQPTPIHTLFEEWSTRQNSLPNAVRLFRTDDGGRHWQVLPRLRPDTFEHIGSLTFA